MKLIDTHCHLTFDPLADDIDGVIRRSVEAGVDGFITVSTKPADIHNVLAIAEAHENVWAALGFHPHDAKDVGDDDLATMEKLAVENGKVVAIGETGLDYHYDHSPRQVQRKIFRDQLEIAERVGKPVVIHCREAFDETMAILDEFAGRLKDVVIHCYSGTAEQTKLLLDRGYYISFTGIVTFKKSEQARQAAAMVPLERMMVETDCPYMSPEPVRNIRPCEPAMMVHIAKRLAEVKGMDFEEFASAVTETSVRFFGLK
jgi:TatD DNase family protein